MNKDWKTLDMLKIGETARIKKIITAGSMRRRLQDLGITAGTPVECVLMSPSRDPVAYRVRGALIALRSEDSSQVVID